MPNEDNPAIWSQFTIASNSRLNPLDNPEFIRSNGTCDRDGLIMQMSCIHKRCNSKTKCIRVIASQDESLQELLTFGSGSIARRNKSIGESNRRPLWLGLNPSLNLHCASITLNNIHRTFALRVIHIDSLAGGWAVDSGESGHLPIHKWMNSLISMHVPLKDKIHIILKENRFQ